MSDRENPVRERDRSRERNASQDRRKLSSDERRTKEHLDQDDSVVCNREQLNGPEHSLNIRLTEKEQSPPLPEEDRTMKKIKTQPNLEAQGDTPMIETEETGKPTEEQLSPQPSLPTSSTEKPTEPQSQASFKYKLLSRVSTPSEDEDITLGDDDVEINRGGVFPAITFSPRVHQFLEQCMKYTVVLKLLGEPIGYRRLQIHLLRL